MESRTRRRRRPAHSCIECRRRKIKCDREDPCAHCVSAKARCVFSVFSNVKPQVQQPPQHSEPSRSTHTRTLGLPEEVSAYNDHTSTSQIDARNNAVPRSSDRTPLGVVPHAELRDVLERVERLENSLAPSPPTPLIGNNYDISLHQPGLQNSQMVLNKSRIVRWSHWMSTGQEFAPLMECFTSACNSGNEQLPQGAEIRDLLAQIGSLLQKCKHTARSIKITRPVVCISCSGHDLVLPSRARADLMAKLYVQSFEPILRILHIPTFWVEYEKFWDDSEDTTADTRLKVLLVIVLGSSISRHDQADRAFRGMVHQWIHAAQSWLSGPLKKDRLELSSIQVHCLTILARQIFSVGGDLVWMSVGSLIHTAMQIGLHRDPKHLPSMPILQAELRRRLWATVLELAVQSSLDSAMPARISLDDFDTQPPSNNNDNEMDDSTMELNSHPRTVHTDTSMQLLLLDSLPVRLRILQLLNGLNSQLSYTSALGLSSELTEAYRACYGYMRDNRAASVKPFHRGLLNFFVRRFVIPLHCPFATQARTNQLFQYSLKTSLDAAFAIVSPEPDDEFDCLMFIGGGLFREGTRLAITVLCLELVAQVQAQHLDGATKYSSRYVELLKQAVRDVMASSLDRIQSGETNVKTHMFLAMVLAQVDATERAASYQLPIARSAKDSLDLCYDLLKSQAGAEYAFSPPNTENMATSLDNWQEDLGLDSSFDLFFQDTSFE